MRFVSPYPGYKVALWHDQLEQLASGQWRRVPGTPAGFMAEFQPGIAEKDERDFAIERFPTIVKKHVRFYGNLEEPLIQQESLDWRVGLFDTGTIADLDLRGKVEEHLLAHPDHDRDFVQIERAASPKPWEAYDELRTAKGRNLDWVLSQIEQIAVVTGTDPDVIERYEREHEDREAVYALCDRLREQAQEERPVPAEVIPA